MAQRSEPYSGLRSPGRSATAASDLAKDLLILEQVAELQKYREDNLTLRASLSQRNSVRDESARALKTLETENSVLRESLIRLEEEKRNWMRSSKLELSAQRGRSRDRSQPARGAATRADGHPADQYRDVREALRQAQEARRQQEAQLNKTESEKVFLERELDRLTQMNQDLSQQVKSMRERAILFSSAAAEVVDTRTQVDFLSQEVAALKETEASLIKKLDRAYDELRDYPQVQQELEERNDFLRSLLDQINEINLAPPIGRETFLQESSLDIEEDTFDLHNMPDVQALIQAKVLQLGALFEASRSDFNATLLKLTAKQDEIDEFRRATSERQEQEQRSHERELTDLRIDSEEALFNMRQEMEDKSAEAARELEYVTTQADAEIRRLAAEHEERLRTVAVEHEQEMERNSAQRDEEARRTSQHFEETVRRVSAQYERAIESSAARFEETMQQLNAENERAMQRLSDARDDALRRFAEESERSDELGRALAAIKQDAGQMFRGIRLLVRALRSLRVRARDLVMQKQLLQARLLMKEQEEDDFYDSMQSAGFMPQPAAGRRRITLRVAAIAAIAFGRWRRFVSAHFAKVGSLVTVGRDRIGLSLGHKSVAATSNTVLSLEGRNDDEAFMMLLNQFDPLSRLEDELYSTATLYSIALPPDAVVFPTTESRLSQIRQSAEQLLQAYETARENAQVLKAERADFDREVQGLVQRMEQVEGALLESHEVNLELEQRLRQLKADAEEREADRSKQADVNKLLDKQLSQLREREVKLQQQLSEARSAAQKERADNETLQLRISDLELEVERTQRELRALTERLAERNEREATLEDSLMSKERDSSRLIELVSSIESVRKVTSDRASAAAQHVEVYKDQVQALKRDLDVMTERDHVQKVLLRSSSSDRRSASGALLHEGDVGSPSMRPASPIIPRPGSGSGWRPTSRPASASSFPR